MYAGVAPTEALAVFGVITYMDAMAGVFFPAGGMSAVPEALAAAATRAGAIFRYGSPVDRIVLTHGSSAPGAGGKVGFGGARGRRCRGLQPRPSCRVPATLARPGRPAAARRGTYSPSAVVWHAGVRGGLPAGTAHHNLFFGASGGGLCRLAPRRSVYADPSFLVTVPSLDEPAAATGRPLPLRARACAQPGRLRGLDDRAGRHAQRPGRRVGRLGFPADVEVEAFMDPTDWERAGMERGTPFGLAHTFFQSGPFRPANVDARAPGLVFVGSSTVPGVGVPMVLVSGKLAAERVQALAS